MSWDDLDKIDQGITENVPADRLEVLCKEVFLTDVGQELLKLLQQRFVDRTPMPDPEQCRDGQTLAMLQNFMMGEANAVREIVRLVNKENTSEQDKDQDDE